MKKFISGIVVGALICSTATVAMASTGSKSITATYRDIKVSVNNTLAELTDANGNKVEPFIYNGTTYLPVRAVATALGQQVSWDSSTSTVYIGGDQPSNTPSSSTLANTVIYEANGIRVTYMGRERHKYYDGEGYDEYEYKIENMNNEEFYVNSENGKVDNVKAFSVGPNTSVPANSIAYDTVVISDSELQDDYHLSSYNTITFSIYSYPSEDYSSDRKHTSGTITIHR